MKQFTTLKLSSSIATLLLFLFSTTTIHIAHTKIQLQQHPVRQDIVEEIKRLTTSWTPIDPKDNILGDLALDQLSMKLGHMDAVAYKAIGGMSIQNGVQTVVDKVKWLSNIFTSSWKQSSNKKLLSEKYQKLKEELVEGELPPHFDARDKWPNCIHGIRDQQLCGSCWAFASSGFLSDRFCIHSEGQINEVLSPQDLVSCSFENFGCQGGQLTETIDHLIYEGIVSDQCKPYMNQDTYCKFQCADDRQPYTKYFCQKKSLTILSNQAEIQLELITNGPMMVGLSVYEDLMNYKEGVYEYTTGEQVGGHAIKLIGWGHNEYNELYWICQNQWGTEWGMGGYINIKAGELGMDTMVMGCMPDIQEIKK